MELIRFEKGTASSCAAKFQEISTTLATEGCCPHIKKVFPQAV